jgi:hypothetical protein
MRTAEFVSYMIAMQESSVPAQRINMSVPSTDNEEDRVQSVKIKLAWRREGGIYLLVLLDPHALHQIVGRAMFMCQTMSFRSVVWTYDDMDDATFHDLLHCEHKDHTDCTPEAHRLSAATSTSYMFIVHFSAIRRHYIRWLRRQCLTVLTAIGRPAVNTPLQRLWHHPLHDTNIWRLVFPLAWPIPPASKAMHRQEPRNRSVKRPARCLDVSLECTDERATDIVAP